MIKVENMNKNYGKQVVLQGVNFHITEPNIIGLVGNNGTGKTTLLNMLMGYTSPTSGNITVLGQQPRNNIIVSNRVGMIDEHACYDSMQRAGKILRDLKDFDDNFDLDKSKKIMELFGLSERKAPLKMSKGMKMQLNIAIGFGLNRDVLFLDEPVAGLDETSRYKFYKLVLDEFDAFPRIMIISTHLLAELNNLVNQILLVDTSGNVTYDTADNISAKYIYVDGLCDEITKLVKGRKIYGLDKLSTYRHVLIENNLTIEENRFIKTAGLEIKPALCNEVCRILCNPIVEVTYE